ncbi:odorant receptor 85c-like [Melitaea cinxia]|uniref:odorant receptor 85c-like n=1 Tax=Melitaea cinxia TaxID=113334 RepID=UPI001E270F8B|nr:odorant receptor 85c-like [Melitaea cinxia]
MVLNSLHFFAEATLGKATKVDLSQSDGFLIYLNFFIIKRRIKSYVIKLGQQWRDESSLSEYCIKMKRDQVKQTDRYTFVYCTLTRVYLHFYLATPLLTMLIQKFLLNFEVTYTTPLKFTLPFDYQSNVGIFVGVYLMDYSIIFSLGYLINCSLFITSVTMSQLRTLFTLLQEDFKEVIKSKDVDVKLKHIIKRHSTLSKLLNELGDAFGAILAIHVLFLSITICFYGIAARIYGRLEDLKNFLVSVLTIVNIYHCCKHGQLVTDSAMDIEKVIYSSAWEQLSIKNKKLLLLTMMSDPHQKGSESTNRDTSKAP